MHRIEDTDLLDADHVERLRRALRQAGAAFAFLHGSRVAGTEQPDSDVDVAAFFGRDVAAWDVVLPSGVDLLVLDGAGLELAGRVATRGVLLFDDDPPARVAWQADTAKRYLAEEPRRRALVRTVLGVVDPVRLARLLQRLGDQIAHLRERAAEDRDELVRDEVRLSATK